MENKKLRKALIPIIILLVVIALTGFLASKKAGKQAPKFDSHHTEDEFKNHPNLDNDSGISHSYTTFFEKKIPLTMEWQAFSFESGYEISVFHNSEEDRMITKEVMVDGNIYQYTPREGLPGYIPTDGMVTYQFRVKDLNDAHTIVVRANKN